MTNNDLLIEPGLKYNSNISITTTDGDANVKQSKLKDYKVKFELEDYDVSTDLVKTEIIEHLDVKATLPILNNLYQCVDPLVTEEFTNSEIAAKDLIKEERIELNNTDENTSIRFNIILDPVDIKADPYHNDSIVVCSECEIKLESKEYSEDHIMTCSRNPLRSCGTITEQHHLKKFPCSTCSKRFNELRNLRNHELIHSDVGPYNCDKCSYVGRKRYYLSRHQYVHEVVEKFRCKVCSKLYSSPEKLHIHQSTHIDIRPYNCNECSYAAKTMQSLIRHLRIHKKERKFPCDVCSRVLSSLQGLIGHQLTHTDERPYNCSECSYAGKTENHLNRHLRVHIPREIFR